MTDSAVQTDDDLRSLRRDLHRHPEPAWCEFYTTARLIEELRTRPIDELHYGREIHAADQRLNVPDESTRTKWLNRAREAGANGTILDEISESFTGAVAVVDRGPGPTIALRVDIDALPILEADDAGHVPVDEGFRSENEGYMHACGHDAHLAMALGTLERVKESEFDGTLTVFFQPAEEISGGGKAMAESGYLDDIDYLLALHIGLDHPTGEIVAGIEKPLAMAHLTATFEGASAHAGKAPNEGANAMQAAATAIQNAYGIPRHSDGLTRINVGRIEGGTASNVIAEEVTIEAEVRGETTALMEYTRTELERVCYAAAEMHDCDVTPRVISESPRVDSHPALRDLVGNVAWEVEGVERVVPTEEFGVSEDVTYLIERVQENGGLASYVLVGTYHPTSHHTPTFDIDEESLAIGVNILSETFVELSRRRP